ncbi:MAG TPA: TetR/AcrR family transcriptional regulator [Jiangellaceae bacterium]
MADVKGMSRKQRAEATRRRIVEAALEAFVTRGYAATTMTAVAADAGVAVQTVYFVFGTKGDLLQAVYEHVVLGPERTPPHLSEWWRAVEAEPDIKRAVRLLVEGTAELLERAAPLVRTVLGDETARDSYDFNEGLRRDGNEVLIRILTGKHPLRPGLTMDRARDILLLLTGPQVYVQLTRDMKWSRAEVEDWMATSVLHQLFAVG